MNTAGRISAILALIVAAAAGVAATEARAQGAAPATVPAMITVTGEGSVSAAPDMAVIPVGVETVADSARGALEANNARSEAVIARLKAAGIAPRDIQTTGLSLGPRYDYSSGGDNQKITGYVASNQVTARVRGLEGLGAVLDAVVADGANQLASIGFALQDPGPAMDEARRLAVADALSRARLLAAAAGVTLGPVLSIGDGAGQGGPVPLFRQAAEMAAGAVPVASGELTLSASVTMVFAIAP